MSTSLRRSNPAFPAPPNGRHCCEPYRRRRCHWRLCRLYVPAVRFVGLPCIPALYGHRGTPGPRGGRKIGPPRRPGRHHRPALVLMSSAAPLVRAQEFSGHNRISTQALTSLAKAAAAQYLGVEAEDVRADWTDDDGLLALSLVTPISIPPLQSVVLDAARVGIAGGSIWDRTVKAKESILAR